MVFGTPDNPGPRNALTPHFQPLPRAKIIETPLAPDHRS